MEDWEALGCGDIHLEGHENVLDDPINLPLKPIKQANKYAKLNGIDVVLFFGDIFDNPTPNKKTVIAFLDSLDPNIDYYIIAGNHEYNQKEIDDYDDEDDNAYQLLQYFEGKGGMPNVHYYTEPTLVNIKGKLINFLPYPHTEINPKADLNIGHFEVKGYHMDNGKLIEEGAIVNTKRLLCGHIHTPQLPVYPGSMVQKNFGETNKKGFVHITINKKLKTKWVPISLPFELITLSIETEKDFKLIKKYKDSKYRLRLLIHKDIEIPVDLKTTYPNIVVIDGFKSKKEKLALESDNIVVDVEVGEWKERKALKTFLTKEGFNKKEIKKCNKLLKKEMKGN